eukprot:18164-Heterococcus_DN1.PRE.1
MRHISRSEPAVPKPLALEPNRCSLVFSGTCSNSSNRKSSDNVDGSSVKTELGRKDRDGHKCRCVRLR